MGGQFYNREGHLETQMVTLQSLNCTAIGKFIYSLEDYFFRTWAEYQVGFGVPGQEHFAGLDTLFHITQVKI